MMNESKAFEPIKIPEVPIITATPVLKEKQFSEIDSSVDAIIFITYASGTTPGWVNGAVQEKVNAGIPVFLVSNNPADNHGILNSTRYANQVGSNKAGALALEKVNINSLQEIQDVITQEYQSGKRGGELGEAVYNIFKYKEDEIKPKLINQKDHD